MGAARAGILKAEHWTGDPAMSIAKAFGALSKHLGADAIVVYSDHAEQDFTFGDEARLVSAPLVEVLTRPDPDRLGAISIHIGGPIWYNVGKILDEVEVSMPGAGATILHTIECVGMATLGVLTPTHVLEAASHMHWQGEDSEKFVLETAQEEGIEESAVIRKADIHVDIPEWACNPKPIKGWPHFEVVLQQKSFPFWPYREERIRELLDEAAMLWKLANDLPENGAKHTQEFNPMAVPLVLQWRNDDMTARLLDEEYDCIQQCGEQTDLQFGSFFRWGDAGAMIEAWRRIEPILKATQLLEQFIQKIGTAVGKESDASNSQT